MIDVIADIINKHIDNEETSMEIAQEILEALDDKRKSQRAKVGDLIRITDNTCSHEFDIGDKVRVIEWQDDYESDDNFGVQASNGSEYWYVAHSDYEIIE